MNQIGYDEIVTEERHTFSNEVETWLKSKQPKTLDSLEDVFDEKGFAIAFMLLMAFSALPIPTGGISHFVFQPITMLLALEMIIGRRTIWLPDRIKKQRIGHLLEEKALPFLMKRIRWFEKWSRPRLGSFLTKQAFRTFVGFVILAFTLGAFFAPPFSGLDTLPSLGVVIIALGLILEDIVMFLAGLLIGSIGLGLLIGVGAGVSQLFQALT